jgi:hypothetical protein
MKTSIVRLAGRISQYKEFWETVAWSEKNSRYNFCVPFGVSEPFKTYYDHSSPYTLNGLCKACIL